MVTVTEAKRLIEENVRPLTGWSVSLSDAEGKILSEDLIATADFPPFPQSSMDGFAFAYASNNNQSPLKLEGEIPAGIQNTDCVPDGTAIRIFTGAPVPPGADTVLMQEKAIVRDGMLYVDDDRLQKGANVRLQGSEIQKGSIALKMGELLSPAAVGFIAGIGLATAPVIPHPAITILVTGNELQEPGKALAYGQVYESNSVALMAALKLSHFSQCSTHRCPDNLDHISTTLAAALAASDVILLTGGVSVGDYDFVVQAAANCGVSKVFHKIKQRPGKPMYFGKKGTKLVFGLPGNPSSVLSCFYQYVLPALGLLTARDLRLQVVNAPLNNRFIKNSALTFFLKGYYDGKAVTILDAQESYKLSSFARANCLVQIDEAAVECAAGETVMVHLLPS